MENQGHLLVESTLKALSDRLAEAGIHQSRVDFREISRTSRLERRGIDW